MTEKTIEIRIPYTQAHLIFKEGESFYIKNSRLPYGKFDSGRFDDIVAKNIIINSEHPYTSRNWFYEEGRDVILSKKLVNIYTSLFSLIIK